MVIIVSIEIEQSLQHTCLSLQIGNFATVDSLKILKDFKDTLIYKLKP